MATVDINTTKKKACISGKLIRVSFLLLFCLSLTGFLIPPRKPTQIDPKLVGVWVGRTQEDSEVIRAWEMHRDKNGKYIIYFEFIVDGEVVDFSTESGDWWIRNKLFHEQNPQTMKAPDVYKYEFSGDDELQFTKVKDDTTGYDIEPYIFTEKKKHTKQD